MLPTTIFIAGALGLAVAILGGGITVKEITIPKVNWLARLVSGCAGCAFVVLAFYYGLFDQAGGVPGPNEILPPPVVPVTFVLKASLGKTKDIEEIVTKLRVYLAGKKVAEFSLDSSKRIDSVEVSVPKPGRYKYSIEGTSTWTGDSDKPFQVSGNGDIDIDSGVSYVVAGSTPSLTEQRWRVFLRKEE